MIGMPGVLAGETLSLSADWPALAIAVLALAVIWLCAAGYGRLLARLLAGQGKVWVEPYELPDILVALVLISWLGSGAVHGFLRQGKLPSITDPVILQSAALYGIIVGGIVLFLKTRKIPVLRLFGFEAKGATAALKKGAGLIVAALPLVVLATLIVFLFAGRETEPQEIVEYFVDAARRADWRRVAFAAGFAVLVAPVTEEFIFRGYFYGVLKRYFGSLPALLLTSALFAGIHLNGPAFLPLFTLAVCLTLAYEETGSLLTPMLMHAIFNALNLGLMFLQNHR